MLDGANQYQIFFQIVLPLAKPGLIAMGIFNFLGQWNQFLLPLVLMPNEDDTSSPRASTSSRCSRAIRMTTARSLPRW